MLQLPERFASFDEARQQGFLKVKKLKEEGGKVVGTYCVFTPRELIFASGAVPVSLCGMNEEPISDAEEHLPRNLCPLIKSSYGFAITDKCPYFYFADLLVGETTCDGKKKMYEYLGKLKPMHIMQLPQTAEGERALSWWRDEMVLLKERLEQEFDTEITADKLLEAIKLCNQERHSLKAFYELGALNPPPLTGEQMLSVLYSTGFTIDKEAQKNSIDELIAAILADYEAGKNRIDPSRPRILITGCPIGGDTQKVVRLLEECGAVVVCFENCSGVKGHDQLVAEEGDLMTALADKYLNVACSCISPNDNRIDLLSRLIDQFNVVGVVDMILQACHTYSVETHRISQFVKDEKGIGYLAIEVDYSQSNLEQLRTRLAAFVEMLS